MVTFLLATILQSQKHQGFDSGLHNYGDPPTLAYANIDEQGLYHMGCVRSNADACWLLSGRSLTEALIVAESEKSRSRQMIDSQFSEQ